MRNYYTIWIKNGVLFLGGIATTMLGGWDTLLQILTYFVICDYFLGVTAAWINDELNSKIGFVGIYKKILLFIPIGIGFSLDEALGTEVLRNMAIWFYLGNEGISIVENLGKSGVPIPKFLEETLVQLREKSDKGEMVK